jgi:hypothetical protein
MRTSARLGSRRGIDEPGQVLCVPECSRRSAIFAALSKVLTLAWSGGRQGRNDLRHDRVGCEACSLGRATTGQGAVWPMTLEYGSLFAGAGLLDFELHAVLPDLLCRWAVEIDDDRRTIFGAHFPEAQQHAAIEDVDASRLAPVAGIMGGIPCNTHSTGNTAGERGLAPQWDHARRIIEHIQPAWTLWESSEKDQSWRRWVPAVRRDLGRLGHASVCFRVRTAGRGASHDRERAIVVSWSAVADAHRDGQCTRAVHGEVARLREAPAVVWDGRAPAGIGGRLADGLDQRLARAIGLGVDQRTAEDAGRVLGALIAALER